MAPRTHELQQLYRDGEEAVFWSTVQELVAKVTHLLKHENERINIATAGRKRVLNDEHDEYGRAKQVIGWLAINSSSSARD